MKYIYYILLIILLISLLVGLKIFIPNAADQDIALVINDQRISRNIFEKEFADRPQYLKDKREFIDSLISKSLLIQEARRLGIDREATFQASIQNFYEQSLLRSLLDQKTKAMEITIPDSEIDRYLSLAKATIHFTTLEYDTRKEALGGGDGRARQNSIPFMALAENMKIQFIGLQEGGRSGPVKTENGYAVYRLDRVETDPELADLPLSREQLRRQLHDFRMSAAIDDWVEGLREKADIKILVPVTAGQ